MQRQAFEKNQAAFFADVGQEAPNRGPPKQSVDQATDIFWGHENKVQGQK